jgi:hypothetical protein
VVSDLEDYTRYYYRVRAQDLGGQLSEWSSVESTILDDDAPSIPTIIEEAEYSQGTTNTFNWLPSTDAGVGVKDYQVQVATVDTFDLASIVLDTFVETASCEATGLADGITYYCRVASRDHLDHISPWSQVVSSTQDDTVPSTPAVRPLPAYSPAGTISLSWDDSSDEGAGMGWYKVLVSKDPDFGHVDKVYDLVMGTSLDHVETGSHMETLYLRVVPVDLVGNEGPPGDAHTTMDIVAPEAPTIDPLPPFSPGTELTLSWSLPQDDGSGVDHYVVHVFSEPESGPIQSGTSDTLSLTITDLADGVRYWYRVTAFDRAGNGKASELVSTTQDASPPGVPTMDPLPEHVPGPDVTVSWTPVTDASGHLVLYRVSVYDDPLANGEPVASSLWILDTNHQLPDLETDIPLYFRVEARDPFGWTSLPSEPSSTTIDTIGPAGQVIDDLPEFSPGTGLLVTWSVPVDDGVGGGENRLVVYADEELETTVHVGPWVGYHATTVIGLADGETHWFVVECRDAFGNVGTTSEPASTTMDATPPSILVDDPGVFGPHDKTATGTVSDVTSGVAYVEASSDGGVTWEAAEVEDGVWSMAFPSSSWSGDLLVRATDMVGNTLATPVTAEVDQVKPTILITSPTDGSDVYGPTAIRGTVSDDNLATVVVEYRWGTEGYWQPIPPVQSTSGMSGTLATWTTWGLSDGDYDLRVTATDALRNSEEAIVSVTLMGANLSISSTDITFSDTNPLPGERVDVMVTVRNSGDGHAEDVTVVLTSGTKVVGEQSGIIVPARGTYIATFRMRVEEGDTELTARASSSYYDTGPMASGKNLETREEEGILDSGAGIVAIIALALAIVILAILLEPRLRNGGEDEPMLEPEPEMIILDPLEDTGEMGKDL